MRTMPIGIAILFLALPATHAADCSQLTLKSPAQELLDCVRDLDARGTWTTIERPVKLGPLPETSDATVVYQLPDKSVLPSSAREVLVYVFLYSGQQSDSQGINFEIFTQDGTKKYSKYFYWHLYGQNAVSFNSENMWFPLTPDRKLFVRPSAKPASPNAGSRIDVIGYR